MGPFQQAPSDVDYAYAPYYAGTVGRSLRLEAMMLQTAQSLLSTRPTIFYTLVRPDYTLCPTAQWGQWTGTTGQSLAVIGLEIWTSTPNFNIWYIAHNEQAGWATAWANDGQFSGAPNHRLEAYAMQILQY